MLAAASPGWLGFPAKTGDPAPQTLSCLTRPGSTSPPTTTSSAMARSLHLLALLLIVASTAGQISFNGGREVKRQEKVVKEVEKVVKEMQELIISSF